MKSGAVTTSVTVVVCVRLPLTPVMVSVYEPAGVVVASVVTERVEVDVAGLVLKLPPETASFARLHSPPRQRAEQNCDSRSPEPAGL